MKQFFHILAVSVLLGFSAVPPCGRAETATNLVILHDQPTSEFKAFLTDTEPLSTNAPIEIKTCPVLMFNTPLMDGYDAGVYIVHSASSLTSNWESLSSHLATGDRVVLVEDEPTTSGFFILETRQYHVLEIPVGDTNSIAPTNMPPVPGT